MARNHGKPPLQKRNRPAAIQTPSTSTLQPVPQPGLDAMLPAVHANEQTGLYEWPQLFDQLKDPVFIHDKDFRILRCNEAYATCAQQPMQAILGKPYWQIFPRVSCPLAEGIDGQASTANLQNSEFTTEAGQVFLTQDITAHKLNGEFWYSQHLLQNITAGRLLEDSEKIKSSFSEAIIDCTPGLFLVIDRQSRLLRWNRELSTLTGRSDSALLETSLLSLLPENEREAVSAKVAEAFATGFAQGELRLPCADQTVNDWLFSARRFEVAGVPYVVSFCVDQTGVKQLENDLRQEKITSDTIIECAPGAFFMIDQQGTLVRWNNYLREETGLSDEQLRNASILSTIHPEDRALAAAKFLAAFATGYAQMEVRVPTVNRANHYFLKSARRLMLDGVPYVAGFCFDVTDRKESEEALKREKEFSDALVESVPGTFYVIDMEGNYFRWNSYLNRLTGLSDRELLKHPSLLTIQEEDRPLAAAAMQDAFEKGYARAELHVLTHERGVRLYSMAARRFRVGEAHYLVGVGIDTTEWLTRMTELEHNSQTDPLTQVANRGHFLHMARQEFDRCRRYGHPLSLWMLDIDHFKSVNDTYGHHAGDLALQSLVSISRQALRDWDIVGRLGGEEFAVLLPETESDKALLVAERLRQAVAAASIPIEEDKAVHITVSIGIASVGIDDADLDTLLERADHALYEAKRTGRDKVSLAENLHAS